MKKIPISFTERQLERLRLEKQKTGNSIASIIRDKIEKQYFDKKQAEEDIFVKKEK